MGLDSKPHRRAALWGECPSGRAAAEALAEIKPTAEEQVRGLIEEIKDDGAGWRASAAWKLSELGDAARSTIPDLLAEIKKPLPSTKNSDDSRAVAEERMAIVNAYAKIAGAKEALPTITELLDANRFPEMERQLVQVYLSLEKDPKRAVPVLTRSLERLTTEPDILPVAYCAPRDSAFFKDLVAGLGAQGENAGSAIPLLLKAHAKAGRYDRQAIVAALGKIGPAAKDALPLLSKLLQSQDADERRLAAEAIQAITKK